MFGVVNRGVMTWLLSTVSWCHSQHRATYDTVIDTCPVMNVGARLNSDHRCVVATGLARSEQRLALRSQLPGNISSLVLLDGSVLARHATCQALSRAQ